MNNIKDYRDYRSPAKETVLWGGEKIFENQLYFEGEKIQVNSDIESVDAIVRYHQNPLNEFKEDRKLIVWREIEVESGDLIKTQKDNRVYLIVSAINQNKLTKYALMRKTNHILKWQDESNAVHNAPCILTDKTSVYSDGLSKTELISLGTDQTSIVVQANEDTLKIPINKRLIFKNDGNNIYEVNRRDNLTLDGLISFVVKKSLYDPLYDNLELNLANWNGKYPEPEAPETPEEPDGLVITGLDKFTVYDRNVEYSVNTDKEVIWTLSRTDIMKFMSKVDNKCVIDRVSSTKIGKSVLKVVLVEDETIFVEKNIEIAYV